MKLGIIGAMDVEVATIRDRMEEAYTFERAHMQFCEGVLHGLPAVVVRCGVGKVNAAACAQILVDCYEVSHVINTGVAGSLDNRIEIGDVVVSTDVVHHDMDATGLGYALGEIPQLNVDTFEADETLRQAAIKACGVVVPGISVFEGRVASGDQFVSDYARKQSIREHFDAMCCEMEGASIAQVCWLNNVPFVVVRVISDKADGSKKVLYPIFEKRSAERCADIICELAAHMKSAS